MKITEIVNPKRDTEKPKGIISQMIDRKVHTFTKLKEVAQYSRKHFHFVHTQENSEQAGRDNTRCTKLHIGSHLLWIDLDGDVNVNDLEEKFQRAKLRGFFYYTSAFYASGERRVRICIVTKQLVPLYQAGFYARQALIKLGYDEGFIEQVVDKSVYNASSYFAPVMYDDGKLVTDHDQNGKSLFIFSHGKAFKSIRQQTFQKKLTKTKSPSRLKKKAQFGPLGDLAAKLIKFKKVRKALARANGTITIEFKNIKEKTKGGYYLNPEVDPWVVFHPNKAKTPFYLNTQLGKKAFAKYKQYVLRHFRPKDTLKELTQQDREINTAKPYLSWKVFKRNVPLLFIESPTGSGKSTALAKWLKQYKGSVLLISVNRAQAVTTHRSLKRQGLTDFECYIASHATQQSTKIDNHYYLSEFVNHAKNGYAFPKVICGVLSLHHLLDQHGRLLRTYDLVVIDEVSVLPYSAVGPVDLIASEYSRFQTDMIALSKLLKGAKKIIAMDGYIAKPVITAISDISRKKPFLLKKNLATNKQVEIYLTPKGNEPNIKKEVSSKDFMKQLDEDLVRAEKNSKPMVIACSYKKKAEEIKAYIENAIPEAKDSLKLITGKTTENQGALAIIRELDEQLAFNRLCYLIYSPAITTGVDIHQAEGTNVYHIISGKDLSAHTHYQMTMRARKPACYKVLFPTNLTNKNDETTTNEFQSDIDFNNNLGHLFSNVPFRENYLPNQMKSAVRALRLKMGSLLTFKALEHPLNGEPLELKEIRKKLKKNELIGSIDCEGVKTAIRLEMAANELDFYDKKYGVFGQYMNLLAREGCLVSIQLDHTQNPPKKYANNPEKYVDQVLQDIRNKLKYGVDLKVKSKSGLYQEKQKIITGQKILNCALNNYNEDAISATTTAILEKLFRNFGVTFELGNSTKLTNQDCISVYDSLVSRIYYTESRIEPEVKKLLSSGVKISDRSKIRRTTALFKIFFHVEKKRKKQTMVVKLNEELVNSVKAMDEDHTLYLYS